MKTSPLLLFCFLNALFLLSMLNSLFTFPWVYHTLWTWLLQRQEVLSVMLTRDHILQATCLCVRSALMNRGSTWTGGPGSCRLTLEMIHPRDGAPLRGWVLRERRASPLNAGAPLRPAPFHLPVSSGCPTTNHRWRKRGEKHRRRKRGKFWPGGDDSKACAFPARGQPVLFILVWLVCSRTGCQHNPFFPPLLPEVMDVKQRRLYVNVKAQLSLFYLWSFRCKQQQLPGRRCWNCNFLIFQEKTNVGLCGGSPAD